MLETYLSNKLYKRRHNTILQSRSVIGGPKAYIYPLLDIYISCSIKWFTCVKSNICHRSLSLYAHSMNFIPSLQDVFHFSLLVEWLTVYFNWLSMLCSLLSLRDPNCNNQVISKELIRIHCLPSCTWHVCNIMCPCNVGTTLSDLDSFYPEFFLRESECRNEQNPSRIPVKREIRSMYSMFYNEDEDNLITQRAGP